LKKTIFNFIRNNYLIITILIVGIALRFYNIFGTFNKIYLWNNNKNEFDVFEIEIIILNGKLNPYGILEPLN